MGSGTQMPPDGGWGWAVVAASLLTHLLAYGSPQSVGVLYLEWLATFRQGKGLTAWVGSVAWRVGLMASPVCSACVVSFGARPVTVFGGLMVAGGMMLSAFAPSVPFLIFSYGVVVGTSLGGFLYAAVQKELLKLYGLEGCLLITAAASLNLIACAGPLRLSQPPGYRLRQREALQRAKEEEKERGPPRAEGPSETANKDPAITADDLPITTGDPAIVTGDPSVATGDLPIATGDQPVATGDPPIIRGDQPVAMGDSPIIKRDPPIATGDLMIAMGDPPVVTGHPLVTMGDLPIAADNLPITIVDPAIVTGDPPVATGDHPVATGDPPIVTEDLMIATGDPPVTMGDPPLTAFLPAPRGRSQVYRAYVRSMARLLGDRVFAAFCTALFLFTLGAFPPTLFMEDVERSAGLVDEAGALPLVSVMAVGTMVGKMALGAAADLPRVGSAHLYVFTAAAAGLALPLIPAAQSYAGLQALSAAVGFCSGNWSITPYIAARIVGIERLPEAYGVLMFFGGLGYLLGPPVVGGIYDWTQSYDAAFYISGGCVVLGGLVLFLSALPCWERTPGEKAGPGLEASMPATQTKWRPWA